MGLCCFAFSALVKDQKLLNLAVSGLRCKRFSRSVPPVSGFALPRVKDLSHLPSEDSTVENETNPLVLRQCLFPRAGARVT
jgi:hypothetical protein